MNGLLVQCTVTVFLMLLCVLNVSVLNEEICIREQNEMNSNNGQ